MYKLYLCPPASTAKLEKTVVVFKFDIASNERESRNRSRLSHLSDCSGVARVLVTREPKTDFKTYVFWSPERSRID